MLSLSISLKNIKIIDYLIGTKLFSFHILIEFRERQFKEISLIGSVKNLWAQKKFHDPSRLESHDSII